MPNGRFACLGLGVTSGLLLVQRGDERGEEESTGARIKDGFRVDSGEIEASPLTQDEIEGYPGEMATRVGSSCVARSPVGTEAQYRRRKQT